MENLFEKAAKTVVETKKSSTPSKPEIILREKIWNNRMTTLLKKEQEAAVLKAEITAIQEEFKNLGKEEFKKMIAKGAAPTSFILRTVNEKGTPDAAKMFIVVDKYATLDVERYEYLKKTYPEADFVEETREFSFNPVLIEKYSNEVSDAISKCKKIPDEDKTLLIICTKVQRVKKGVVDKLFLMKNNNVIFNEIAVICMLKDTK